MQIASYNKFTEEEVEFLQKIAEDTWRTNVWVILSRHNERSFEVKDIQKFLGLLLFKTMQSMNGKEEQLYVYLNKNPDFSNINFESG